MTASKGWPAAYDPAGFPVYAHNEIRTALPPERLWPVLVDAAAWPRWYSNARRVRIHNGHDELAGDVTFTWTTFGLRVTSTVHEFVPYSRLAWEGKALGSHGYHRWDIQRTADGGSLIVTEEVQGGLMARVVGPLVRRGLHREHQRWLEGLVHTAEQADAPGGRAVGGG